MTDFEGKMAVAVITGAGGDIGRAIAHALAPDYKVIIADIDGAAAKAAADEISSAGHTAIAVSCDITDTDSVLQMAETAREIGPVKLLVNNAGGITDASLSSTELGNLRFDLALNLEGAVRCFKAFETDLKREGALINIASVNGLGVFGHPGYSMAKAGLLNFTKSVAVEYGRFGLRANAVAPGTVRTQAWNDRAEQNPQVLEDARRWYPLQRVADPAEVAAVVAFLASPAASAITGVCLPVDCGLTAGQALLAGTFSQSPDFSN